MGRGPFFSKLWTGQIGPFYSRPSFLYITGSSTFNFLMFGPHKNSFYIIVLNIKVIFHFGPPNTLLSPMKRSAGFYPGSSTRPRGRNCTPRENRCPSRHSTQSRNRCLRFRGRSQINQSIVAARPTRRSRGALEVFIAWENQQKQKKKKGKKRAKKQRSESLL